MGERVYYYAAILLTVGVLVVAHCFQSPLTLNLGQGNDGVEYCRVAACLKAGVTPSANSPYVYRVGTPILAVTLCSSLPIVEAFHAVNLMACLLIGVAAAYWFRMWIKNDYVSLGLLTVYLTQWHGPFRFVAHYPAYVDPWFLAFFWAGLILIESNRRKPSRFKTVLLCGVIFVGTLFRDSAVLLGAAAMFVDNPMPAKWPIGWKAIKATLAGLCRWRNVVLLASSFAGTVVVHSWCKSENGSGALQIVGMWAYQKPFLIYLQSCFVAFGPAVLILVCYKWRLVLRFLGDNQYLGVMLVCCGLVGWVGGSDTERLLYWSAPIVLVLTGLACIELWPVLRQWKVGLALLIVAQAVSQRLFWTLPDLTAPGQMSQHPLILPIFTICSSSFDALDLAPCYGRQIVQAIAVAEYVVFFLIMLLWVTHADECHEEKAAESAKRHAR